MANYSSYYRWANNGEPDCYYLGNDFEDGDMEGEKRELRVDVDPLLLQELRDVYGDHWTDQTICRHAIATLVGYPSYAACARMEHFGHIGEQEGNTNPYDDFL